MGQMKLIVIAVAAAALTLPGPDGAHARGGGHMGGGHTGGGWSGGRAGGGGFERGGGREGGGEWRGDRPGERGSGERWEDRGDHNRRNNRNNNNNNTTNNVNVYGPDDNWGWGWGAADGAIAGLAMGAAIGAASSQPSTVIIEQSSNTNVQQAPPGTPQFGTQVTVLPSGCESENIHGIMVYRHGSTWYRPYFGSSGVYYEVVPPPPAEGSVSASKQ